MTQPMFIQTRQQLSALALSATVTLGMLLSVNMLATQPATDAQMANAASATTAQLQSTAPRNLFDNRHNTAWCSGDLHEDPLARIRRGD